MLEVAGTRGLCPNLRPSRSDPVQERPARTSRVRASKIELNHSRFFFLFQRRHMFHPKTDIYPQLLHLYAAVGAMFAATREARKEERALQTVCNKMQKKRKANSRPDVFQCRRGAVFSPTPLPLSRERVLTKFKATCRRRFPLPPRIKSCLSLKSPF